MGALPDLIAQPCQDLPEGFSRAFPIALGADINCKLARVQAFEAFKNLQLNPFCFDFHKVEPREPLFGTIIPKTSKLEFLGADDIAIIRCQ